MRPERHWPSACTGTRVSSVWITFPCFTRLIINSINGLTSSLAASIQAHMVLRARSTPWRSKIFSSRYSGRWSPSLLTITYASSPGPGSPFSIGCGVLVAISTWPPLPPASHARQAYLCRTCLKTLRLAGTYSNCSLVSLPMRVRSSPQHGHAFCSSVRSWTTSMRGR